MARREVQLKVAEAHQDDVNKGIVRLDTSYMKDLDVRPGAIVEIEGERKTVAITDRALPGDLGLNIIRMDGLARRNAKTTIGEVVRVRKVEVLEAKKVTVAPARKGIMIRASPQIFKRGLLGRAVVKGDIVSLGGTRRRRTTMSDNPFFDEMFSMLGEDNNMLGFGLGDLKFVVVDAQPAKKAVLITENTRVVFNPEAVEVREESSIDVTYEDIGGLDEEMKKVREMVELPLKHPELFERLGIEPPKGVLLHGPPGTGKTLLAKAIANETNSHFILINGPEIMSKYYGQSEENLRKKFEEAEKNAPSIIFIDELDAIATKREESKGEVERRVVAQLLTMMDGLKTRGKVVVIAATNIPNQLDPALRRPGRFDREIEIGVPRYEGRLNILKIHTRNMPLEQKGKDKVDLTKLAAVTHGFVGADLSALAKEAAMIVLRRVLPDVTKHDGEDELPEEILEKLIITREDFLEALKVVRPSALREVLVETPNIGYDDIGGLAAVKQELIEAVDWPLKHKEAFSRLGVRPPKGVLLYGPPGTGKTLLAKAIAKECEANFIPVKGPELLSKWVGESEKAVRKIFEKARQTSPAIIFFDEIDSLAPTRKGSEDGNVTERVVNQLLTEMDGLQDLNDTVIIASTNQPQLIDTALMRPGRFDRIVLVPVPDIDTRRQIFEVHMKRMAIDYGSAERDAPAPRAAKAPAQEEEREGEDAEVRVRRPRTAAQQRFVESLAQRTQGYTGADIESVCREAAMLALRDDIKAKDVSMKYFELALAKVRPSVNKEIEDAYKDFEGKFRQARGKQMAADRPSYYG